MIDLTWEDIGEHLDKGDLNEWLKDERAKDKARQLSEEADTPQTEQRNRSTAEFITGTQIGDPQPLPNGITTWASSSDEPQTDCDTCRHKGVEGCEQPCLGCGCCGLYEAMTENDKLKEKVVEFIKSCARCKHRPIGAMMCEESCHYEPKTEPQTERSE